MISRMLNSKTKTITFAALLVASFAFLSRVLGLVRNNLLGNIFPSEQADIYLAAFRIPDFVFSILITGGIVAAFLPVFAKYFQDDEKKAKELAGSVLFVFTFSLALLSFVLFLFAGKLTALVVPGFSQYQREMTSGLMRIMFLSPIILGVSAIFSSILQYFNLFLAYSLAPVFYNLGIIFGILFLAPRYGLSGVAFGVVIGALMHLLIQIPPALKHCFCFRVPFKLNHPGLKRIFKLMAPRTIGAAGFQINLIVITAIASTLSAGAIRTFSFSNDLYGVPIGLIGISFAAAVFPMLSKSFTGKDDRHFMSNFSNSFSQILFLIVPLTFMMFLLRAHIVRLFYGTLLVGPGYFGWADTRLTAASVGVFSIAIFSGCLIPLLAKTFYAAHDTKTPVKITMVSVVLNIFLALGFVRLLQYTNVFQRFTINFLRLKGIDDIAVVGLPLALSISSIVQCILLLVFLRRKLKFINFNFVSKVLFKVIPAGLVMSVLMYLGLRLGALLFNTRTVLGLLFQVILVCVIGVFSYLLITGIMGCQELKDIVFSVRKQFRARP
ncbi:MAG: murein biosynthesis integral membrane protein MurJ [Parcubacteria group bacterium]|nr:murein biosynthesis integral membrane protein MurJ [Parcubacteria group bacterium]